MEKHRARSFYGLGIFAFFLYFMEVSSASSASATKSIIDVMRSDEKLHNLPPFLYENNITEVCHSKTFPEKGATNNIKEIFPCLLFYDTMYKVCEDNKVDQLLKNVTTFYLNIQSSSVNKNRSLTEFCHKIRNVTFSYEKLKPFFENIRLDNAAVCSGLCIGVDAKFIPLCAMLDWKHTLLNTKNHNEPQSNKLEISIPSKQNVKPTLNKASEAAVGITDNVTKKDTPDPLKSDNETQMNKLDNILSKGSMPMSEPSVAKSDTNKKQNTADNANSSPANKQKEAETIPEKVSDPGNLEKLLVKDDKPEEPKKSKQSENTNANDASNIAGGNKNDASNIAGENKNDASNIAGGNKNDASNIAGENKNDANDNKSDTISPNTQEHDNPENQEESQNGNDERISEMGDGSMDTADQSQSILELSSHKNIGSPYSSSMRADEESHFFTYFTVVSLISIAAYIGYHNKQKILAIVLEGRRSRNSRGRRRPSTASYRKLDCTLEEAVTSQCNANVTHVIY